MDSVLGPKKGLPWERLASFAMTADGERSRARATAPVALTTAGFAVTLALIVAISPLAAAQGASGRWTPSTSLGWNNGLVACDFNLTSPSVAVTAVGVAQSGLSSGVAGIAEVNPAGQVVTLADWAGANWTARNASTPSEFDLAYAADLLLVAPGAPAPPTGTTEVQVDYILAGGGDAYEGNARSVEALLQISNWTWQASGDHLVVNLPVWPTFASTERLAASGPGALEITSSSNATGALREYLVLSDNATAAGVGGRTEPVGVVPLIRLTPSFASVNLTIGSGAGEFSSLRYAAVIEIPVPSSIAGIPLYEYVIVGSLAGVVSVLIAVGARRVRQQLSDSEYAEE